jgi:4,5-dihydroxyphthalate decarboxylase
MSEDTMRLKVLLGDYPVTAALRRGEVASSRLELDFDPAKPPSAGFKRVVRDLEFEVAELAIVTFLMAKAYGKPLVLVPAVVMARAQHPYIVYNTERGHLGPGDLAGRRVGIRSYSVTTAAWIRGILMEDHGLDPASVSWVTFEAPHVAEYRDPPNVVRAPEGRTLVDMLLAGEIDAAILPDPKLTDPRLARLFPDPEAAAQDWSRRHGAIQINHMVVAKASFSQSHPDALREFHRMLAESRRRANLPTGAGDLNPFGVEANRRNLEIAIEYVHRQGLIPRRFAVDELFDDVTRGLGGT